MVKGVWYCSSALPKNLEAYVKNRKCPQRRNKRKKSFTSQYISSTVRAFDVLNEQYHND